MDKTKIIERYCKTHHLQYTKQNDRFIVETHDEAEYYDALRYFNRKRLMTETVNPYSPTRFIAWIGVSTKKSYMENGPIAFPSSAVLLTGIARPGNYAWA